MIWIKHSEKFQWVQVFIKHPDGIIFQKLRYTLGKMAKEPEKEAKNT
jgi:hypothetical protein